MQLHPEKDQHLLVNGKIIEKIIEESDLSDKDFVIEVGAGSGILTSELVKNCKKVLAFETDKNFEEELDKIPKKNLEIIYGNALNFPWVRYNKIIANIPYSISEPLVMKAIGEHIEFMVLMVGENFKEILEDKISKVGIVANLFFKVAPILKAEKNNFEPRPRVDSWIVKFERKIDLSDIEIILQDIFFKEGKIKNAILYSLVNSGKTKRQAREIIEKMKIDDGVLEKPVKSITGKFLILLRERLENLI